MYELVTKYALLGVRPEAEPSGHLLHLALRPVPGAPHDFASEEAARQWALNNHDEMRHHREFVVLPVHHLVLSDAG